MKVDTDKPFRLIYSLYQHEYLGFLFESYVVQLNDLGNLTFTHQNISAKNAREFHQELEENDYKVIEAIDSMQQEVIFNKFYKSKRKIKQEEFFLRTYDKKVGDKLLQAEIDQYLEKRRTIIMPLLQGKLIFEMGPDGEPAWKQIHMLDEKATILFHFRKNEDNTHYFPTIKLRGEKLEFREKDSYIIADNPAWMMVDRELFSFEKEINGSKLKPFLKKKFILIPKNVEDTYYQKFVAPLVASFDVYAKGFDIKTERFDPQPVLTISEVKAQNSPSTLFSNQESVDEETLNNKVLFELSYKYGEYNFRADQLQDVSVSVERDNGNYTFHRVERKTKTETRLINDLYDSGLQLRNSRITLPESTAFEWLNSHHSSLLNKGFIINQQQNGGKKYFLGESRIEVAVEEKIDWFDIKAVVKFGDFEIPIQQVRKLILKGKSEVKLPNGEIGIIPSSWTEEYKDLFKFSSSDGDELKLKKHHIALVQSLKEKKMASVMISRKLEKMLDNARISEQEIPRKFKGKLRPYQQAGFNWMTFLNEFGFGGCLADDMGLGKTIQTLVMLQDQADRNQGSTNLIIMPTSLIYNWQLEARKFTPKLKILNYTGTNRIKDAKHFSKFDIVLTSYGITRMDTDILADFYFNYIILDESQAIKNPDSNISQAVKTLNSRQRLILTGTPIENSTMDLWSQISFINPGLLGEKSYFKKEYLIPIEKKGDLDKTQRLNAMINPFILRREKTQVAKDLPEKTISVKYCELSETQREYYEREKSAYRNHILDCIEKDGLGKSQMILLEGLTKLRQIANHPRMIDPNYEGDSGKLEDITYMIDNALGNKHNILIFSQFVKHLKIVSDVLKNKGIEFAYLDGSVKDRQKQVEKFQETDNIQIFLISLKAGGLGLNLTKADFVFLLDPWWNPAIEAQAIDRAHRIGQKNKVFTYKFIVKDTVEEKILRLQESKLKLVKEIIPLEESFVKNLSTEDIRQILS